MALSGTRESARVLDAGGGWCTNTVFSSLTAACQPTPVGPNSDAAHLNCSGFLQAFLMHTNLDNDADGIVDENDPDDDNDALGDAQELAGGQFDPSTETDPMDPDSDGDGASDGEEAAAGTNPTNEASLFSIRDMHVVGESAAITWQGRDGRVYDLMAASNAADAGSSASVVTSITARGGSPPWFETETTVTNVSTARRMFYRLTVRQP
jgi:hypothetical protein